MEPATDLQTDLAAEVWQRVIRFAQEQWTAAAGRLQEIGLTPGHLKLLMMLEPGDARPMGALAQDLKCDASTMTWLVDRLEERNLVERRAMPGDRRVKAVALTSAGADIRSSAQEKLFHPPDAIRDLDPETLEMLRNVFQASAGEPTV